MKQKHGSVFEHAYVTVAFINVSRVFTHEMVRHRAGCAYSQESLRFVRLEDLSAYEPEVFDDEATGIMKEIFEVLEKVQVKLAKHFNIDSLSFSEKKKLTSAFRRLAPIGLQTNLGMSANHRAWRHIFEMRGNEHAEEEMKVLYDLAWEFRNLYPAIYQDMVLNEANRTISFEHGKI
jgi:thymidylate synthase (FAD)